MDFQNGTRQRGNAESLEVSINRPAAPSQSAKFLCVEIWKSRIHQHRLHDLAGVHCFERFLPALEFPLAANDRIDVELAGGEQLDHAFPDGPVVAEAALEADVLLHERVEGAVERLWSRVNSL